MGSAWILGAVLLAGCLTSPPPASMTPSPHPSSPTTPSASSAAPLEPVVFVLMENRYQLNRTSGSGSTYGEVGGHCDEADYTLSPVTLDLTYRGSGTLPGRMADPHAVVVRHYEPGAAGQPFASVGGGDTFLQARLDGGTVAVRSPFHDRPTLLEIAFHDDLVAVNGTVLAEGATTMQRFVTAWSEQRDDQTTSFESTERITVHNLGHVRETAQTEGYCF